MPAAYAPEVYVSVMAVRGRIGGWKLWLADLARRWNLPFFSREGASPTALVDLAARGEVAFRQLDDGSEKLEIDITVPDQRDTRLSRNRRTPLGPAETYLLEELRQLGGKRRKIDADDVPKVSRVTDGFEERLEDLVAEQKWYTESPEDAIRRWSDRRVGYFIDTDAVRPTVARDVAAADGAAIDAPSLAVPLESGRRSKEVPRAGAGLGIGHLDVVESVRIVVLDFGGDGSATGAVDWVVPVEGARAFHPVTGRLAPAHRATRRGT